MSHKGDTWNESEAYGDPITLRPVRRLTRFGLYNETPTYHTGTAFTADGEYLAFIAAREGQSMPMKARLASGELTQLTDGVPGVGARSALHLTNGNELGDGRGIEGCESCLAPRSRWYVYVHGAALKAVHLDTLQERVLIEDIGREWLNGVISISPDEQEVIVALRPSHPEIAAGKHVTRPYVEWWSASPEKKLRIISVPLAGGPGKRCLCRGGGLLGAYATLPDGWPDSPL